MEPKESIKEMVKQKYGEIALQGKEQNDSSCCGSGCCTTDINNIMSDDYSHLSGYNPDADLGLGCGLPTQFAKIKTGDTVIDLGSGAGNDAFIARHETGPAGKVLGIDFTPAMIERARTNAEVRGFNNVEFRQGDIENIPVSPAFADVIVSNCVLNLVPDKDKVFKEIFRVLKEGGHFSISDIVLKGTLPEGLKNAAEMYAGCISGAIEYQTYLDLVKINNFSNIAVQSEKPIRIPEDILRQYIDETDIKLFNTGSFGIFSITVYAEKPKSCCGTECCN